MSQGNNIGAESERAIRAASPSAVCQVETLAVGPRSRTGKSRGKGCHLHRGTWPPLALSGLQSSGAARLQGAGKQG